MAKQTLPTNFKDDILDSSMGGKRRYNLIQNSDGTYSLEDVTTYTQVGSNFGAGQINQTNIAVNASADAGKIIDSKDTLLATTANGYIAGAKAVKEVIDEVNSNLNNDDTKAIILQMNGLPTALSDMPIFQYDETLFDVRSNVLICKKACTLDLYTITSRHRASMCESYYYKNNIQRAVYTSWGDDNSSYCGVTTDTFNVGDEICFKARQQHAQYNGGFMGFIKER